MEDVCMFKFCCQLFQNSCVVHKTLSASKLALRAALYHTKASVNLLQDSGIDVVQGPVLYISLHQKVRNQDY